MGNTEHTCKIDLLTIIILESKKRVVSYWAAQTVIFHSARCISSPARGNDGSGHETKQKKKRVGGTEKRLRGNEAILHDTVTG